MLPVIDLSNDCIEQLRDACHSPGFCYLTGHGIPPALDAAVLQHSREFFALPVASKQALAIANSPHFRGYTALGGERTKGASDWREQLDVGPEESTEQIGLGQPADHFDNVVLPRGDPHLKIIRYPAQSQGVRSDQGVGWHHDSGLVSFVLQEKVGGLQIEVDGRRTEAVPKPGMYVMNLGEMLQAATSGYLHATPHRVVSPPPGRERISVAYFFHPRLDAGFAPIDLPPELARLTRGGQNADPGDPIFTTFGENYLKIRLRSHPDVAGAHYPDLPEASG